MEQKKKNLIVIAILVLVMLLIIAKPMVFPEPEHQFEATNNPKTVYQQALKDGQPVFLEFFSPG